MARRSGQMTVADLRKKVKEYLNHLEMQRDANPDSMFFLNGLTKWVWKTGNFPRSEEIASLGPVLTTLIREGKLELNISNLVEELYFRIPNR